MQSFPFYIIIAVILNLTILSWSRKSPANKFIKNFLAYWGPFYPLTMTFHCFFLFKVYNVNDRGYFCPKENLRSNAGAMGVQWLSHEHEIASKWKLPDPKLYRGFQFLVDRKPYRLKKLGNERSQNRPWIICKNISNKFIFRSLETAQ